MMDRSCSAPDPQAVDPQPTGTNLPEPLVDFVARFNAREFWESHEVLEIPWRTGRSEFYHGLILYASAFVHAILAEAERYRQRAATGAAVLFPTLRLDSALVRGDEPELEA
jgi:hypothetical protein